MTQAVGKTTYTVDEYFAQEVESDKRHEYRNGEIIAMTGGTPNHNEIASNLTLVLKLALRGQPYRVFVLDQRLWIPEPNLHTYPDVMVVKKPLMLQLGRTDTVMNPCLVAEVLSKSTQDYDRGKKFLAYRAIANVQDYVLIDQYRVHVEHYAKTGTNQWLFTEYDDTEATLSLRSIALELKIADLYDGIEMEPSIDSES